MNVLNQLIKVRVSLVDGDFKYPFEEFTIAGLTYSGTLVVDTVTNWEMDEAGEDSFSIECTQFKGINHFQRLDLITGDYSPIDTTTDAGRALMTVVGMAIIDEPAHLSTENRFQLSMNKGA